MLLNAKAVQLANLEVLCRLLATTAHDFILNNLTLIEGAQSSTLNRGNMDEYVLAAAFRLNESVALGRVEPFYGSCCHLRLLASYFARLTLLIGGAPEKIAPRVLGVNDGS